MTTDYERAMQRALEECPEQIHARCDLARGHPEPCWASVVVTWLGLGLRCDTAPHPGHGYCWRSIRHRGEHEGPKGGTWRRAK